MSRIFYSSLPPTPSNMTAEDMSILRDELQEDTLQTLLRSVRLNTPSSRLPPAVYDIRDYFTDAQNARYETSGAINATDAIQEIFDEISAVPGVSSASDAVIKVPGSRDLLQIEDTCTYIGGVGQGLVWQGDMGLQRGGASSSGFTWVGAEGGTMFDLQALNGSVIENLTFSGGDKAKYLVRGREFYDGATLIASSGVLVTGCRFSDPTLLDGDSVLFAIGDDSAGGNRQASEYNFIYNDLSGCNELGTQGYGIKMLTNGNCKNLFLMYVNFGQLYRGAECGSGDLTCIVVNGSNIGYNRGDEAALINGYGNTATVLGGRMENGTAGYKSRYIKAGGTGLGTSLQAKGFYFAGTLPADDYAIVTYGPSEISGHFESNSRVGANHCRVQAATAETSGGSGGVSVTHSVFGYNSTPLTDVPVYDGSNNLISTGDYARNTGHRIRLYNNVCGLTSGNKDVQLPDITGDDTPNLREQMKTDGNDGGLTIVRNSGGNYVVTIPYTAFAANATLQIGELQLKSELLECIADTTALFSGTGLSGTIQLRVGIDDGSYDDDSLILAHDVKSGTTRKGTADADLGVDLALATQPRGKYFGAWTGTGHNIKAKLIASVGSLSNLLTGSVTIYITHRRVG